MAKTTEISWFWRLFFGLLTSVIVVISVIACFPELDLWWVGGAGALGFLLGVVLGPVGLELVP